jgi:hypothetical protein
MNKKKHTFNDRKNYKAGRTEWKIQQHLTATTTDLGIRLNGKLVLYLEYLANPKIGLI